MFSKVAVPETRANSFKNRATREWRELKDYSHFHPLLRALHTSKALNFGYFFTKTSDCGIPAQQWLGAVTALAFDIYATCLSVLAIELEADPMTNKRVI